MEFDLKVEVTPQFKTKTIYDEWIGKDWLIFQDAVYDLGEDILGYMRGFIGDHSHRANKTGNLINTIKLYRFGGFGEASVGWSIGHIPLLNSQAKYWKLLNFGGMSWAGLTGKAVPGHFGEDNAPNASQAGTEIGDERFTHSPYIKNEHGKQGNYFMHVKSPIKGINYIEKSMQELDKELANILSKIKQGTIYL
jgi:hypothetical protein